MAQDLRVKPYHKVKNHGTKFHYERKTKYNHGMIEPDLVWACAETTISAESIKP
jgi:hypothetical protein